MYNNKINTDNKFIDFDEKWQTCIIEKINLNMKYSHPLSNYYLKPNDLSINLFISLKWIKWGYVFLKNTSNILINYEDLHNLIDNSIQIINLTQQKHILLLDNIEIKDEKDFNDVIENIYLNTLFDENSKIHFKLKININEFIMLSQTHEIVLIYFD